MEKKEKLEEDYVGSVTLRKNEYMQEKNIKEMGDIIMVNQIVSNVEKK